MHGRLAHPRVLSKNRLDLAQLDAKTTHFGLIVEAPEMLERAVIAPAGAVTGAVERGPRGGAERVRDEALGGELGPPPVAERDPNASNAQFAWNPDRAEVALRIEDVDGSVGNRVADGNPIGSVSNAGAGGPHRGLGGSIQVPQLDTACDQLVGKILGQGFATDQGLERGTASPARLQKQAPGGRSGLHDGGAAFFK